MYYATLKMFTLLILPQIQHLRYCSKEYALKFYEVAVSQIEKTCINHTNQFCFKHVSNIKADFAP